MAGLLGDITDSLGFTNKNLKPSRVDLDPAATALINEGATRALGLTGQEENQGLERVNMLGASNAQADQEASRTGQDPALLKALYNQYNKKAGRDVENFKKKTELESGMRASQQLRQAAQNKLGQQQAETNYYSQLTNAYNQNEAARAGFVTSLFQLGGVASAYAGGAKPQVSMTQPTFAQPTTAGMGAGPGYIPMA